MSEHHTCHICHIWQIWHLCHLAFYMHIYVNMGVKRSVKTLRMQTTILDILKLFFSIFLPLAGQLCDELHCWHILHTWHIYVNMGVKRSIRTLGMQPTILDILQIVFRAENLNILFRDFFPFFLLQNFICIFQIKTGKGRNQLYK